MRGAIDPAYPDLAAGDCRTSAEIAKILRGECAQDVEIDDDAGLVSRVGSFAFVFWQMTDRQGRLQILYGPLLSGKAELGSVPLASRTAVI